MLLNMIRTNTPIGGFPFGSYGSHGY